MLNAALKAVRGEIVLLTDANTFIESNALRQIVPWFADSATGVVCGRLVLTDGASGANSDGLYWRYETFMKECEGRLGALLGANGAIYAIRRSEFSGINGGTIVDDLVIPLVMHLRTGCRIVYDPSAVAREETAPSLTTEFRRRARIGAGGFHSLSLVGGIARPRHGWLAFSFISHKLLRWLCPFWMLGALATNVMLADDPFYRVLLAAQLLGYGLSVAGLASPHPRLARGPALDHVHHDECGAPRWLLDVGQRHTDRRLAADREVRRWQAHSSIHSRRQRAPAAQAARRLHRGIRTFTLPRCAPLVAPVMWTFVAARTAWHFAYRVLVCEPFFKAACTSCGRGRAHGRLHPLDSGPRQPDRRRRRADGWQVQHYVRIALFAPGPTLTIGDHSGIGHGCRFTIGKRITIGRHCRIAADVWMFDSSGHPLDPAARQAGDAPGPDDVRPITIGDNVWIGGRAIIHPGVTIGDHSIVSAGAVVMSDVPPHAVVAGNPARAVMNAARPASAATADAHPSRIDERRCR